MIKKHSVDFWTGTIYSTNRRVWEHDADFKKYLRKIRVSGIDMETATVFLVGFDNEIPRGALLLVSDSPMAPGGIKTSKSDSQVTSQYVGMHLDIGIDALLEMINSGESVKHLRY